MFANYHKIAAALLERNAIKALFDRVHSSNFWLSIKNDYAQLEAELDATPGVKRLDYYNEGCHTAGAVQKIEKHISLLEVKDTWLYVRENLQGQNAFDEYDCQKGAENKKILKPLLEKAEAKLQEELAKIKVSK